MFYFLAGCSPEGMRERRKMRLIPLKEASQMVGSKDDTGRMIRNLWKQGQIVAVKIGRSIMVDQDSLEDYIAYQIKRQN